MQTVSTIIDIVLIVTLIIYAITDIIAVKQVRKVKLELEAAWMAITTLLVHSKIRGIKRDKNGNVSILEKEFTEEVFGKKKPTKNTTAKKTVAKKPTTNKKKGVK